VETTRTNNSAPRTPAVNPDGSVLLAIVSMKPSIVMATETAWTTQMKVNAFQGSQTTNTA